MHGALCGAVRRKGEYMNLRPYDLDCLRAAIAESEKSVAAGNHPFGAVLADAEGRVILRTQNTVGMTGDATGHAETNLMRLASLKFDKAFLETCTMYTSAEPCVMCSGAVYWAGVKRVLYGLSEKRLFVLTGDDETNETLELPCREVFAHGRRDIEVLGPLLEDEAEKAHKGFWKA